MVAHYKKSGDHQSDENTSSGDNKYLQNLVPIHLVDVNIFHRISKDFDLQVVQDKKLDITNVIKMNPQGTRIVCIKFHGNPSNSFLRHFTKS